MCHAVHSGEFFLEMIINLLNAFGTYLIHMTMPSFNELSLWATATAVMLFAGTHAKEAPHRASTSDLVSCTESWCRDASADPNCYGWVDDEAGQEVDQYYSLPVCLSSPHQSWTNPWWPRVQMHLIIWQLDSTRAIRSAAAEGVVKRQATDSQLLLTL